ncbi:hypothetical protein KD909_03340 [Exiguobacterium sp. PFWT01]|uniref:hypothetical protein n=1 Tax=Exiguobacterium sp. PFWT01 TaxID=2829816 RepID=UPI001BAD497A|nr:hypothetical protein [Exiguobacterium sp. PFWT01]QUP87782.1 hypothetical protein KD909_03340 [Exiguobacterium sp. PFWT01]
MKKQMIVLYASIIGSLLLSPPITEATAKETANQKASPSFHTYSWLNHKEIRIGGKTYTLPKRDQQFLLQNKQALQRAKLAVVESKSGKTMEIIGLELNMSGKSSTRTVKLDGMGRTFKGEIRINAKNIKLEDIEQVNRVILTKQATATTQLMDVNATTLIQQTTKHDATKPVASSTNIVLNESSVQYLDILQPQTRLYVRDESRASHVRLFADAEIRSSANAGMMTTLLTGHKVNTLKVYATVNRFANLSHELELAGKSTIRKIEMTSDRGRLTSTMTGTIDELITHGATTNLAFKGPLDVKQLTVFGNATLSSEQLIQRMTSHHGGATLILNAPIGTFQLKNQAAVTLGNEANIDRFRTEADLILDGSGSIRQLEATALAGSLKLNAPITELIVRHNEKQAMTISGTSSISSVLLDGSSPVTIDITAIGSIEGSSTNTSTVDLGQTEVDVITLPGDQVITKRPETEPTPPFVVPSPDSPPKTTREQLIWILQHSTGDYTIMDDVSIGGFETKRDTYIEIAEGVTLTIDDIISGSHRIQFFGNGTLRLEDPSYLSSPIVSYSNTIKFDGFAPEGVFGIDAESSIFKEIDHLQSALANPYLTHIYFDGQHELNEPLAINRPVHVTGRQGASLHSKDNSLHHLIEVENVDGHVTLEQFDMENRTGGGLSIRRVDSATVQQIRSQNNLKEAFFFENVGVTAQGISSSGNGMGSIRLETSHDEHARPTSLALHDSALLDEKVIFSTTPNDVTVQTPDWLERKEGATETYWTYKPGIYSIGRQTTEPMTSLQAAVDQVDIIGRILISGVQTLDATVNILHADPQYPQSYTLIGMNGGTLEAGPNFQGDELLNISADMISLKNLVVQGAPGHGLVYDGVFDGTLNNVTVRNNGVGGIFLRSGQLSAYGLNTSGNGTYGVRVDRNDTTKRRAYFIFNNGHITENVAVISEQSVAAGHDFVDVQSHDPALIRQENGTILTWVQPNQ